MLIFWILWVNFFRYKFFLQIIFFSSSYLYWVVLIVLKQDSPQVESNTSGVFLLLRLNRSIDKPFFKANFFCLVILKTLTLAKVLWFRHILSQIFFKIFFPHVWSSFEHNLSFLCKFPNICWDSWVWSF